MVQNVHCGEREELPFDLKHKAGPIQYRLAPDASKEEIAAERAKLRGKLVEALRPYLSMGKVPGEPTRIFEETPCTGNAAFFWTPSDVLVRTGLIHPLLSVTTAKTTTQSTIASTSRTHSIYV